MRKSIEESKPILKIVLLFSCFEVVSTCFDTENKHILTSDFFLKKQSIENINLLKYCIQYLRAQKRTWSKKELPQTSLLEYFRPVFSTESKKQKKNNSVLIANEISTLHVLCHIHVL